MGYEVHFEKHSPMPWFFNSSPIFGTSRFLNCMGSQRRACPTSLFYMQRNEIFVFSVAGT